ncbi:ABC transporter permease, partial [Streptomyces sp. 2MCAF27]
MRLLGNGLARAAVRFKPAAFAGTFIALMLAAAIVSACGILLESGLRATVPPGRYASAPVVIAAEQRVGDRDESEPAPDRVRLDASLVATATRTQGVAAAAPDWSFPVQGGGASWTAHGWGSAPFTGVALGSGAAPRKGEVVLDPAAARAARVRVGGRVTLT